MESVASSEHPWVRMTIDSQTCRAAMKMILNVLNVLAHYLLLSLAIARPPGRSIVQAAPGPNRKQLNKNRLIDRLETL